MTRQTLGALLILGLVLSVAQASDVGVHRLPNGVTVLTMPAEWNRIVAVSAVVDAGARHDPRKQSGLAHLTVSMLPQGTTTRTATELAEVVDGNGIKLGTEITHDYAHVYVTTIDSRLDIGLEVLADVLQNPSFNSKRLLEVQRIAHETLEARADDPFHTPVSRARTMLFNGHPYARDVEGTEEGVDRVTAAHLVKFHTERYVGQGTVIAIVGDFSPDDAVDRLTELLSEYPEGPATPAPPLPPPPPEQEPVKLFADVEPAYLAIGFPAPSERDGDLAVMAVLDALVGMGSGSRLSSRLGEDGAGLAEKIGSVCRCGYEVSTFMVFASTESADETVFAIEREFAELSSEPVPDAELTEAKNRLIGRHVITGQTNLVRALRLAVPELLGLGFDHAESFLAEVNRVDKDDIMRVASEWLRKPATVIVYPGKSSIPQRAIREGI
jgi:predicted Zn-dependent peptidase